MAIDPAMVVAATTALKLGQGAKALFDLWKSKGPQGRVESEFEQIKEELQFETCAALHRLGMKVERMEEILGSDQFPRAWRAALLEASVSVEEERIRLLAAALAGLAVSDAGADMKARAFRVALQLEPSDAVFLRVLDKAEDADTQARYARRASSDRLPNHEMEKRFPAKNAEELISNRSSAEADALEAAGCITRRELRSKNPRDPFSSTMFTEIGRAVLALLESYAPKGEGK